MQIIGINDGVDDDDGNGDVWKFIREIFHAFLMPFNSSSGG